MSLTERTHMGAAFGLTELPAVGSAGLVAVMYQDRCLGALSCSGHR